MQRFQQESNIHPCVCRRTDLHFDDLGRHATVEVDEDDAASGASLADVVAHDVGPGVEARVDAVVDHVDVGVPHLW